MSYQQLFEAIDTARLLRPEGDVSFGDLFDDMSHEDKARLVLAADDFAAVWSLVRKVIDAAWVESYHSHGSVEVDGFRVWAKKTRTDEKCVDEEGFFGWLASEDPQMVSQLFNANYARKGSLPAAARSTFFEKRAVEKPETATTVPVDVLDLADAKKEAQA